MSQAIPLRRDYTADQLRRLAVQSKDAAQARRLLAIAAVLDGASRADAARIGGMDRQTLRDWVIRFNAYGPDGLISIASPGVPAKLTAEHRAFLGRIVEEGPIPAVHGVVRWRACDLIALLQEEFAISVSDDTVYRALKDLGFAHLSARPKAYRQDADAIEAFKKRINRREHQIKRIQRYHRYQWLTRTASWSAPWLDSVRLSAPKLALRKALGRLKGLAMPKSKHRRKPGGKAMAHPRRGKPGQPLSWLNELEEGTSTMGLPLFDGADAEKQAAGPQTKNPGKSQRHS